MEATTTLAESLLDDLDDLDDLEEEQQKGDPLSNKNSRDDGNLEKDDTLTGNDINGINIASFERKKGSATNNENTVTGGNNSYNNNGNGIKTLEKRRDRITNDTKLQSHLTTIRELQQPGQNGSTPSVSEERTHNLITASNKHLLAIQTELLRSHRDLVTEFEPRFPELEELLPDPIKYKNAVKVIQNETDMTLINEPLNNIANLTPNQIITLSVAGSTTSGLPLSTEQLDSVNSCIAHLDEILSMKSELIAFVEKYMDLMAPSTCALIGPTLAARIVGTAGGLAELSRIPSCNLQVLGQVRSTSASRGGMSTTHAVRGVGSADFFSGSGSGADVTIRPHQGILAECELYRQVPEHMQRKALKVIAAKLALVIRCDYVNAEAGRKRTNESGLKFRREIEEKFYKWEEPDKAQVVKALPNFNTKVLSGKAFCYHILDGNGKVNLWKPLALARYCHGYHYSFPNTYHFVTDSTYASLNDILMLLFCCDI